ncbi:MAG: S9 family peptidase [Cardiobacteriaceae bacterium]|nr:S9 family peptidase [Cardiobacteriaceae bacterium]
MLPPKALKKPHVVASPFGDRIDEYYWLRDDSRENAEMLQYLHDENAYADATLAPLKPLQEKLYQEALSRIHEDDSSLPYQSRGFWYYSRMVKGLDYPIYARRKVLGEESALEIDEKNRSNDFADEEILLNVNELAAGHDYYSAFVGGISFQSQIMAWLEDTNGRRQYTIRFKDLKTGKALSGEIKGTNGSVVWAEDGDTLFYIENDAKTLLSKRIYRYQVSTAESTLVYEEPDDSFYLGLDKTRDLAYVLIHASSTVSDEIWLIDAKQPEHKALCFRPRERDLEYSLDHYNGKFYIRTNEDGAFNFKIMTADSPESAWQTWIAHQEDAMNEGLEIFEDFVVVAECSQALERLLIMTHDGKRFYLEGEEACCSMGLSANADPKTDWVRYGYSSMITPAQVYEINVKTGEKRLLKTREVKHYQREDFRTERVWITARDGVKVPVSLVYHQNTPLNGTAPLFVYGYGSYGHSLFPSFSSGIVRLLERGVVYAILHVRGGEELGRKWYEGGKMFNKMNTFTDFIDATKALCDLGYGDKNRVAAQGGSAGGLLMGAICNLAPECYRVVVSNVPFVDVVTTMLDESIPLTTNEYDEWGNPSESRESYDYMLRYSPYDNLEAKAYPAMFISTGLWDSQVQYWEPAKYVAKLRELYKGEQSALLLRTNMEAGHGGKSGRYQRIREDAEELSFVLHHLGIEA